MQCLGLSRGFVQWYSKIATCGIEDPGLKQEGFGSHTGNDHAPRTSKTSGLGISVVVSGGYVFSFVCNKLE